MAEMRMVRWVCDVKEKKDKVPSKEWRDRLGLEEIISLPQWNRLEWYGHVLQKRKQWLVEEIYGYEIEGSRPRGSPKRTWTYGEQKDS